ncbi:MAG: hypothetical protein HPY73_08765 [Methanomassiliicoccales archaeon]|nr:MAG: hypothetical protein HPY73_08765 [Methanomassiliicoccales archaeon]
MAEVKAHKQQMGMVVHKDILASEADAILGKGAPIYYSLMTAISEEIRSFMKPGARVVDLYSHGGIWIEHLKNEASINCRFLSINSTEEEKERCKNTLRMNIHLGEVEEHKMDLSSEFPDSPADLVLAILGMSRIERERALEIFRSAWMHMSKNSAMILTDVIKNENGKILNWPQMAMEAGFKEVRMIWHSKEIATWMMMK